MDELAGGAAPVSENIGPEWDEARAKGCEALKELSQVGFELRKYD